MTMHEGHRARLRARFRREGLSGFAPHEVIELLLLYGRARGDVNPTAHALLDTFGSLKGVLEARPEQLMNVSGVGEETATLISLMVPMFRRYTESLSEERTTVSGRAEAEEYCRALLIGCREERFYVISLSAKGEILGRRLVSEGTTGEVNAYPRTVAESALNHNASGVIVCHNHPGGTAEPSAADVRATIRIAQILSGLGITLLDHIVVSGDRTWSMAQHGQLSMPAGKGGAGMRETDTEGEMT